MATPAPLPVNTFKQAMTASGLTRIGLWSGLPDSSALEILAGAGFDWILIDAEHAPWDLGHILVGLQTLAAYPVAPIVRPPDGNPTGLKRLLDIGAQTLLIPMVETPEQAEQAARAVRYPPEGFRGLGSSLARAARWNQVPDYATRANDEIMLIVQVETGLGLENLDAIVGTPGVDGVFIGPSDLAAALGRIGQANSPEMQDIVAGALSRIAAAGKPAGVLAVDPVAVERYVAAGARFVGVGTDTGLLMTGARALASQFAQIGSRPEE